MGRKKKVIEETPQVKEQSIKEIEVNSSTPISYKGKVQIQIKRGNKIISSKVKRNRGSDQMFIFLANCLAGKLYDNLAPDYVVLLSDTGSNTYKILSNVQIRRARKLDSDRIVSYQFLIPYNNIINYTSSCNMLALTNSQCGSVFSNQNNEIEKETLNHNSAAIIELSNEEEIDLNQLETNDAILIVWSMEISATLKANS